MVIHSTLGVIGDVHCEDRFLLLAIETFRQARIEAMVCTGDLPNGRGDFDSCCALLRQNRVPTVRGNHDRWLLNFEPVTLPFATSPGQVKRSSWDFLAALPVTIDVPTPSGLALLCHGLGQMDMAAIGPDDSDQQLREHPILEEIMETGRYRWIINGHSHRRMVRPCGPLTLVNAGTLRRDHAPCFAAIDFQMQRVQFWDIVDQQTAIPGDDIPLI